MEKEQFRGVSIGSKISHLCFSVPSNKVIRKQSHIQCINNTLYENSQAFSGKGRTPVHFGVLDCRLGTSQKDNKCETCGQTLADCVGHFGYIDLQLPVFHAGYFRYIINILQTVCKRCSRVLLGPEARATYSMRLRKPELSYLEKKALHKEICEKSKKAKFCPWCGIANGQVKKFGLFKIVHVNNPATAPKKSKEVVINEDYTAMLESMSLENQKEYQELSECLKKLKNELLDPIKVRLIFEAIPDQDLPFLLIKSFRPEDLVITRISVPPACIRPSVVNEMDASNEDDLTIKLSEIIFVNETVIAKRKAAGAQMPHLVEDWDFLQLHVALYINSETSGIPFNMRPKKPSRGLVQRLKGKHGRFRGNLSGKRVDFSSRSVISPNPNLQIDQVGVPEHIAKILTYPERVNRANIDKLRLLVLNGAEVWPGANFVEDKQSGARIFLKYGNRKLIAAKLRNGDIVERHLADGDMVLFNRQPSLHKLSIMCHQAKVHKHRTLQFNECDCTPYNADFDGDEMNLHLPQTEEAKAEAAILMGIKNNIVTPRNGEPLIAAIQDFITGAYLMTHKDTFFERAKAMQIISSILAGPHETTLIDLPTPCILKPRALWSGKQIFSLVMRPNKSSTERICLRTKGKNYSGKGEDLCVNDAYVVVKDSELLCGAVEKTHLGSGSKNNIFYVMLRDINSDAAAKAMWRLARVTSYFLANRGFSLGIDDVTPTPGLLKEKKQLLENGYDKVEEYIANLKNGKLDPLPGHSPEDTLEAMILKELSVIRDYGGKSCLKELGPKNAPLIMAMCGSKGSLINVSQMVACVGQQAIRGARVPDGYGDRSLPHFDHKEKSAKAKGFVENSFYSGLTATEFFFHTMAGREGLLDTAVKTAETGYMQRRLVKALEDLVSHYDGSVRNSRGEVIQFVYGDDALDPASMEDNNKPVNLDRLLDTIRVLYPSPEEPSLSSDELKKLSSQFIDEWDEQVSSVFKTEMKAHFFNFALRIHLFRKKYSKFDMSGALGQVERITRTQLKYFLGSCLDKYLRAKLEPATAVGAICAQSIGEPCTQLTLKTFHFAGVASMNITQGVPRIKELINANKTISTPIVRAALVNSSDPDQARCVKMRLEKTTLGEVCEYLEEVVLPDDAFVLVKLYADRIRILKLEVNENSICESIMKALKLSPNKLEILSDSVITVRPQSPSDLWQLREQLQKVVVKGISSIKRAAIRIDEQKGVSTHYLMIEGEGLRNVMATYGVDPNQTYSNNILEVASTLGVEAGRVMIIREIEQTMQGHGISIDERHLKLLADMMTYRGEVLGITRFGLAKMKESALMLASFERTADHLFDAAYFGQEDAIIGVSESIISGVAMKVGTGFFDLVYKLDKNNSLPVKRKPVFDDDTLHNPFTFEIDPLHFVASQSI